MTTGPSNHWDDVYRHRAVDRVSWFQASAQASLDALAWSKVSSGASLIDVGGGASVLVDDLLSRGWSDLTVLDLAPEALKTAKARLGSRATKVEWKAADITTWRPDRTYDVWHDRAVFHFLTSEADRSAYKAAAQQALSPGGILIIATFAPDGPAQCSGLPVRRYGPQDLEQEFTTTFKLAATAHEVHLTPSGAVQPFTWVTFRRRE